MNNLTSIMWNLLKVCVGIQNSIQISILYIYNSFFYSKKVVKYIKNGFEYYNKIDDYDFILEETADCAKVVYDNNINTSLDICNFSFIDVEVKTNDKTYSLALDKYYLINNIILKRDFILWYIYNNYNELLHDYNYTVNFIDNEVNIHTLNNNQYILLHQDNYKIITTHNINMK